MFSRATETHLKPTQKPKPVPLIKEEEDDSNNNISFSRLLSAKDDDTSSMANPSFRVYYGQGAAGSVPFIWESQPGTPKHYVHSLFSDQPQSPLPPLTPPPSSFRDRERINKEEALLPAANPTNFFTRLLKKKASLRKTSLSGPMLMPDHVKSRDNNIIDYGNRRQSFDSVFIAEEDEEDHGSSYFCFKLGNSKRGSTRW